MTPSWLETLVLMVEWYLAHLHLILLGAALFDLLCWLAILLLWHGWSRRVRP